MNGASQEKFNSKYQLGTSLSHSIIYKIASVGNTCQTFEDNDANLAMTLLHPPSPASQ
ncbi:MAG TPA: hypothetical protein VGQ04_18000 [Chitinophagaceae bacterium]|jgi:hypothetical protein|nr:hypothetical protein [Chitinophagaceae bacterium]